MLFCFHILVDPCSCVLVSFVCCRSGSRRIYTWCLYVFAGVLPNLFQSYEQESEMFLQWIQPLQWIYPIYFSKSPTLRWLLQLISNYTVLYPGNHRPRAKYSKCQGVGRISLLIWNNAINHSEVALNLSHPMDISYFCTLLFIYVEKTGDIGLHWFHLRLFFFFSRESSLFHLLQEWLLTIGKLSQTVGQLITAFLSSPCKTAINYVLVDFFFWTYPFEITVTLGR